jgi:ubiquinone/menaquinone biosynthesis C-methylase UbiE
MCKADFMQLSGVNREAVARAYQDADALVMRQDIHNQYSFPQVNFVEWVLSRIQWRGDEYVLDVGSGQGAYFEPVQMRIPRGELVAGDLSLGMARSAAEHPASRCVLNLDAEHLPFPKHTFDVVLANHVLFHVPDLDRALSEIHRVLKPSGVLLASTNSQANMPELDMLFKRVFGLLGVRPKTASLAEPQPHFHLEDAPMRVARYFFAVARHDLPSTFIFPSAQPLIDYVNSTRALREPTLPRSITWQDFMNVFADQAQRIVNHFGEIVISKLAGAIVASDMGGFSREYVQRLLTAPS